MKIKIALSLAVVFITAAIINSCGDTVTDNGTNPGGCTKTASLLFPPSDTTYSASSVDFRWSQPSCIPAYYKLFVSRTGYDDTVTTQFTFASLLLAGNYRYYWKVRAYYGTPVNDSSESLVYDFFLEP